LVALDEKAPPDGGLRFVTKNQEKGRVSELEKKKKKKKRKGKGPPEKKKEKKNTKVLTLMPARVTTVVVWRDEERICASSSEALA